jgi:hypothetical protein
MGREGKNRPLARAGRLVRSTPAGRRAPGLAVYTGGLFLFGNERAAALGVPRLNGLPGEGLRGHKLHRAQAWLYPAQRNR